jgi:guanylate kinase
MKNEKIIICGGSGSGKDFLLKGLIEKGERYEPKITTRPIRQGELNGVNYNYINNNQFTMLYENDQIKVHQKFIVNDQTWYYALTKENFKTNNLFIMTPYELSFLTEEERKGCFVVYLDIPESIRRQRIFGRNDNNDSVQRRLDADRQDFMTFTDYDMKISDHEFDIDLIYDFAF